jgi:hypothetical protein
MEKMDRHESIWDRSEKMMDERSRSMYLLSRGAEFNW